MTSLFQAYYIALTNHCTPRCSSIIIGAHRTCVSCVPPYSKRRTKAAIPAALRQISRSSLAERPLRHTVRMSILHLCHYWCISCISSSQHNDHCGYHSRPNQSFVDAKDMSTNRAVAEVLGQSPDETPRLLKAVAISDQYGM